MEAHHDFEWKFDRTRAKQIPKAALAFYIAEHWNTLFEITGIVMNSTILDNLTAAIYSPQSRVMHLNDYELEIDQLNVTLWATQNRIGEPPLKSLSWRRVSSPVDISQTSNSHHVYLGVPETEPHFYIRFAKREDRFHPLGSEGSKLLFDYLSDQKCPVSERQRVMVVVYQDQVVWVVGYQISHLFRVCRDVPYVISISVESL